MQPGLSVVIPCRGRLPLLERLLASVAVDAQDAGFPVEVLLVDDTPGEQRQEVQDLARRWNVAWLQGVAHVGGNRNLGASRASHAYVLFLDSDVVIRPGTLRSHFGALSGADERVAGCVGKVTFVGESTFAWRVIAEMQLTLPFSYPDVADQVPWGPTPNISFRKAAFFAVGGFDITLPPYGGEDVDLGLRLTRAGYILTTSRAACAEHAIETWSTWAQNLPRLLSYGRADYHLLVRHPERSFLDFPTGPLLWLLQLVTGIVIALATGPQIAVWVAWAIVVSFVAYHLSYAVIKLRRGTTLSVHLCGPLIFYTMDLAKAWEAIRHGRPRLIFFRLKFLDDLIAQDWPEIAASIWGLTASAFAFAAIILFAWFVIR